jgi:hypothetical protein
MDGAVSLDVKGGEAFGGFGADGYVVDGGQAGAGVRPVDQAADILGRALEDRFDPAVGQVAHPADHAVLLGQAAAGVAEEDALDPAGYQHPITHHKQTVRRVGRRALGTGGRAGRRGWKAGLEGGAGKAGA